VISLMREWGSLTNSESADSSSSVVIVRTTKLRGINPRKLLALKIMWSSVKKILLNNLKTLWQYHEDH
jgi:hypothetical protein